METNLYQQIKKIGCSEKDCDLLLKPSFLLQFLQDVAADNAEFTKFGYSQLQPKNLAWFLLKYHMEFLNYPQGIDEIAVQTNPRGYNKIFAIRDFNVWHEENLLARIVSSWALVNLETRAILPLKDAFEDNTYMKPFVKQDDDLSFNKINSITNIDKEQIFAVRYDDIDTNGHVNNSNYIIWAFEPLDLNFRHAKKLKTLDMVFKKEIRYGNKVLSQVQTNGNTTLHVVKNYETGEDLCLISAEWIDK